jgi:hypothetical protein
MRPKKYEEQKILRDSFKQLARYMLRHGFGKNDLQRLLREVTG